jgi:hypothetical protein
MLQTRRVGLSIYALFFIGFVFGVPAQQPGPLSSPQAKLDHLLATWQGKSLARLQEVWGREKSVDLRRGNRVYVFERHVKVRAAGLGVAVFGGNGLSCVAQFEIDDKDQIVRSWWQGGGVQECWGAFRRYEP